MSQQINITEIFTIPDMKIYEKLSCLTTPDEILIEMIKEELKNNITSNSKDNKKLSSSSKNK